MPEKINYLVLAGIALFVQYLLPILLVFLVIAVILGNVIVAGVIVLVSMFNPIALLAFIPVVIMDIGMMIVLFIAVLVMTIVYWVYYFKKISYFALLPLLMWIVGFVLGFVPYIGNITAAIMSLMPWMALAVGLHWIVYRQSSRPIIPQLF